MLHRNMQGGELGLVLSVSFASCVSLFIAGCWIPPEQRYGDELSEEQRIELFEYKSRRERISRASRTPRPSPQWIRERDQAEGRSLHKHRLKMILDEERGRPWLEFPYYGVRQYPPEYYPW